MGFKPTTHSGYDLWQVRSAIQKTIRRGDEKQSYFWALEMCQSHEDYFWRTLLTCVHEDIGLANPSLMTAIPACMNTYYHFRKKKGPFVLVLANAILLCCRSPKSRLADEFQLVVGQAKVKGTLTYPIPDYALDKHTREGRRMGRTFEHWMEHGCKLFPEAEDVENPYSEEAKSYWRGEHGELVNMEFKDRKAYPDQPEFGF